MLQAQVVAHIDPGRKCAVVGHNAGQAIPTFPPYMGAMVAVGDQGHGTCGLLAHLWAFENAQGIPILLVNHCVHLPRVQPLAPLAGPPGSFELKIRPVQTGPDRSLDKLHQLI